MLKVNFKLDPASEAYLNSLPKKFSKGLSKALVDAMLYAEGKAKSLFVEGGGPALPPPGPLKVRSGHSRRSITSGVDNGKGWIGSNVKYLALHELGLGRMPKRPTLGPSFEGKNLDKIGDILVDGIFKEMN